MKKQDWIWMPHPGHLAVGSDCRFHLNTYVGDFIVSTVGEWWPERPVREIHAQVHDPKWLFENGRLKGDNFDRAYMKRFGFEEIGYGRTYETFVFKAESDETACCPFKMSDPSEVDSNGYNDAGEAYKGHLVMCEKWANSIKEKHEKND